MQRIDNVDELNTLPQFSVVQFRGLELGESRRLVWQLDGAWFAPGSDDFMYGYQFPQEAYPARVLWRPDQEA
ncbi:hypothetical protein PBI_WHIRLWIND_128 [Mycobacterium phage Whirlwind]|uniref:Uncharacterized protein n=1 Tax=Mycobacterium phage Whirlwind TaxID=1340826 RepID=S5XYF5_9CAUD|nr:hypothetical protein N852_gp061 [Mycobacterium phage Whirlwind]AGT12724.1 hypothetical protein PBI_WHIRLWIND_128 [Mycobacterium phage Whirlwind]